MTDGAFTTFFSRWRGRAWRAMNSQVWDGWFIGLVVGAVVAGIGWFLSVWLYEVVLAFLSDHVHDDDEEAPLGVQVALAAGFMMMVVVGGPVMEARAPRGIILAASSSLLLVCAASLIEAMARAMSNLWLTLLVVNVGGFAFLVVAYFLRKYWVGVYDANAIVRNSSYRPFDPAGVTTSWQEDARRVAAIPHGTRVTVYVDPGGMIYRGYFVTPYWVGEVPWVAFGLHFGLNKTSPPYLVAPARGVSVDWR